MTGDILQRALWRHLRGVQPPALRLVHLDDGTYVLGCRLPAQQEQPASFLDTYALDTGFGAVAGIHVNAVWKNGDRDYMVTLVRLDDERERAWYADARREGFVLHCFLGDRYVGSELLRAQQLSPEEGDAAKVILSNRQRTERLSMSEDRIIAGEAKSLQGLNPRVAQQLYHAVAYTLLPFPRTHRPNLHDAFWFHAIWQTELTVRKHLLEVAASPPAWLLQEDGQVGKDAPLVALLLNVYRRFVEGDRPAANQMRRQFVERLAGEAVAGAWADLTSLAWDLRRAVPADPNISAVPLVEAVVNEWILTYLFACEKYHGTHYVINAPVRAPPGRPYEATPDLRPLPEDTELAPFWINTGRFVFNIIGLPFDDLVPKGYIPVVSGSLPELPDLDPTGELFEALIESAVAHKAFTCFMAMEGTSRMNDHRSAARIRSSPSPKYA